MQNKRVKCYIYIRVSTAMQVDGYILEAQNDRLTKYAEFQGMEVVRCTVMPVSPERILQADRSLHRCFRMWQMVKMM